MGRFVIEALHRMLGGGERVLVVCECNGVLRSSWDLVENGSFWVLKRPLGLMLGLRVKLLFLLLYYYFLLSFKTLRL